MPTYQFTASAEQDAAITARRLKVAPEVKDNATFVAATVRDHIVAGVVEEFIEGRVQKVADAYRNGTAQQRTDVDKVLGIG